MRFLSKLAVTVGACALPMLALTGVAQAAPTITVEPLIIPGDGMSRISGTECLPQKGALSEVLITFSDSSAPLATTAAQDGTWSIEVKAASDIPEAVVVEIYATCDGYSSDFEYATAELQVVPELLPGSTMVSFDGCTATATVRFPLGGPYALSVNGKGGPVTVSGTAELGENVDISWDVDPVTAHQGFTLTANELVVQKGSYPAEVLENCAPAMSISLPGMATPGQTIQVAAATFHPGEKVSVTLHSTPVVLANLIADDSGAISTQVTIPQDTTLGAHTIVVNGEESGRSVSGSITIALTIPVPPAPAPRGPQLAATGVDVAGFAWWGLGLALLGGAALTAGRRRGAVQDVTGNR